MTVYTRKGDLLLSDCNLIVHQANCMGKMGAGIARQIAIRYPQAVAADLNFPTPVGSTERLGKCSVVKVDGPSGKLLVVNLYSQHQYGKGKIFTNYKAFERGLASILRRAKNSPAAFRIGMPYGIGCGLAGGDWSIVEPIIERLSEQYEQDIYLYQL